MSADLLTDEDLKGLEEMCRRRQGRRMTVTLDLDVMLSLLRDARALRRVEALPDKWREEARHYPDTPEGDHAAAAVRLCAREIEKALATTTEPADAQREERE